MCVCVWVCVCVCQSTIWYMGRKNKYWDFFVWKFGFWPGEVMEKSWNFFLRFLWEPWFRDLCLHLHMGDKKLLTHWGRMTHICVGKLTIIGSDNGLSPGRRQAIIWTNAEILLIRPLRTNFSEILIEFHIFSIKKRCRLWNGVHFVSASMC